MNFKENKISHFFAFATKFIPARFYPRTILGFDQGNNARKVISEVYAFFVLQCTVFGRKSKHKTDVTA